MRKQDQTILYYFKQNMSCNLQVTNCEILKTEQVN